MSFRFVLTQRVIQNSKKIAKIFKNTIMAPFQATIGWRWMRKEENKKLSFRSVPTWCVIENSKKKKQKNSKKLKNTIMAQFRAKIVWKRMRKGENKNYRFIPFLSDA